MLSIDKRNILNFEFQCMLLTLSLNDFFLFPQCMSPAYRALQCAGGECGLIIQGSHTKCPRPCTTYKWCSDCLAAPGCGWCAIGGLNGRGVCLKGGVKNPINGSCDEVNGVVPGQGEVLSGKG